MSDDFIGTDLVAMKNMADTLHYEASALNDIRDALLRIAGQIEHDVLKGEAGEALHDAIGKNLATRVDDLAGRIAVLEKNVRVAGSNIAEAESNAGKYVHGGL